MLNVHDQCSAEHSKYQKQSTKNIEEHIDRDNEHNKHKHCHKDKDKDKDKTKEKSRHHDCSAEHSKKHHEKA